MEKKLIYKMTGRHGKYYNPIPMHFCLKAQFSDFFQNFLICVSVNNGTTTQPKSYQQNN